MDKECRDCHIVKPTSEFYLRSGMPDDGRPTNYTPYCKSCQLIRVASAKRSPKGVSSVESENVVMHELMRNGIMAQPGKDMVGFNHVDLVAMGMVMIEVKQSQAAWNYRHDIATFRFVFTPRQVASNLPYHIVVLVCEPEPDDYRFHVFNASDRIFRNANGAVIPTLRYVTGGKPARVGGSTLSPAAMEASKDRWNLVWDYVAKMRLALLGGKRFPDKEALLTL